MYPFHVAQQGTNKSCILYSDITSVKATYDKRQKNVILSKSLDDAYEVINYH